MYDYIDQSTYFSEFGRLKEEELELKRKMNELDELKKLRDAEAYGTSLADFVGAAQGLSQVLTAAQTVKGLVDAAKGKPKDEFRRELGSKWYSMDDLRKRTK